MKAPRCKTLKVALHYEFCVCGLVPSLEPRPLLFPQHWMYCITSTRKGGSGNSCTVFVCKWNAITLKSPDKKLFRGLWFVSLCSERPPEDSSKLVHSTPSEVLKLCRQQLTAQTTKRRSVWQSSAPFLSVWCAFPGFPKWVNPFATVPLPVIRATSAYHPWSKARIASFFNVAHLIDLYGSTYECMFNCVSRVLAAKHYIISNPIGSIQIPLEHTKTMQEFPDPPFRVLVMQYIQCCGNRSGLGSRLASSPGHSHVFNVTCTQKNGRHVAYTHNPEIAGKFKLSYAHRTS